MNNSCKITDLLLVFKDYLFSENLSPNSISNYMSDIRYFLLWAIKPDLSSTNSSLFSGLHIYLKNIYAIKNPSTARRHASSLGRFIDFYYYSHKIDKETRDRLISILKFCK